MSVPKVIYKLRRGVLLRRFFLCERMMIIGWCFLVRASFDFCYCQASRAVEREMAKNYADQMGILYMEPVAWLTHQQWVCLKIKDPQIPNRNGSHSKNS